MRAVYRRSQIIRRFGHVVMGDGRVEFLVREPFDSVVNESLVYVLGTFTYEAFDRYASLCDWFVTSSILLVMSLLKDIPAFLDDLNESTSNVLAVPIALVSALVKVVAILLSIATFPMRVAQAIARNYPILTLIMLSFFILCFFVIRRITRQSVVSYFLYTFIPYCVSIVYTVFGVFFPQVHTFSRIIQMLLHPIRWLLGIAEQVDSRARPIREVVEVFSPGSERRRAGTSVRRRTSTSSTMSIAEKANNERIQCCVCIYREKTVLLRPCNHICLCETCFQAVMNEPPPKCPICRTPIESYMNVFL